MQIDAGVAQLDVVELPRANRPERPEPLAQQTRDPIIEFAEPSAQDESPERSPHEPAATDTSHYTGANIAHSTVPITQTHHYRSPTFPSGRRAHAMSQSTTRRAPSIGLIPNGPHRIAHKQEPLSEIPEQRPQLLSTSLLRGSLSLL